jgi:hypothetical protein
MAVFGLTGSAALSASATTILWGVVSGSTTVAGAITWLDVTFNAATSAQGIQVQLFRATGGIPTLTSYTANKLSADAQPASKMASAWVTPVTATPTGQVIIENWYFNPAGGSLIQWPLNREEYMPAGTTNWVGLQVITPSGVSPSVAYNVKWNEL